MDLSFRSNSFRPIASVIRVEWATAE